MDEKIEEMQQVLSKFFEETPMELSFNHDNGEADIIKEKQALKVLDDITRQALIPMFSQVLVAQGYRKEGDTAREILQEAKVHFGEMNGDRETFENWLCKRYGVDLGVGNEDGKRKDD